MLSVKHTNLEPSEKWRKFASIFTIRNRVNCKTAKCLYDISQNKCINKPRLMKLDFCDLLWLGGKKRTYRYY